MEPDGAMLAELGNLIENGVVKTVIYSIFPMDETRDAYEALKNGHGAGKIAITIA